jgi:hypothetical protein
MLSGSLTYQCRLDGIEFDQIELRSPEASVEKIDVASDKGGNVLIEVQIGRIARFSDAKAVGLREANRVVNKLSITLGRQCYDPFPTRHALSDQQTDVHYMEDWTVFTAQVGSAVKLGTESLADLASALNEAEPPGEANYRRYRSCLNITDVASRFLALYRLLGLIVAHSGKDTQAATDELIRRHEPEVPETMSPQSDQAETIYSKLRNEYVHTRHMSLAQVQSEMEDHLPGLIAILQKAIRNP